jgi:hypothetical protein
MKSANDDKWDIEPTDTIGSFKLASSFSSNHKANMYRSITAVDSQKGFWVQFDSEELPMVRVLQTLCVFYVE